MGAGWRAGHGDVVSDEILEAVAVEPAVGNVERWRERIERWRGRTPVPDDEAGLGELYAPRPGDDGVGTALLEAGVERTVEVTALDGRRRCRDREWLPDSGEEFERRLA